MAVAQAGLNAPPIFRLDVVEIRAFLQSDDIAVSALPEKIVDAYNRNKKALTFALEDSGEFEGCHLLVYRNVTSRSYASPWSKFYQPAGVEIREARSQNQQFIGFVAIEDELFAHTGGQASHVFERFIDVSFPIAVARRVAQPEVKRARSSPLTGAALATDVNFRDPRRITHTESLENVWTALSGQVRTDTLVESEFVSIYGHKKSMRVEVASSIKFTPRVESLEKLIKLMRWTLATSEAELPEDDEWRVLDSIALLNPRKSKGLIESLKKELSSKLFAERNLANFALTHVEATLYANADTYIVTKGSETLLESDHRPSLGEVVEVLDGFAGGEPLLGDVSIASRCPELGADVGTNGTLFEHLHGEMQHEGQTYFLLAGRWYRVDGDYVRLVTEDLATVLEETDLDASTLGLPQWQEEFAEKEYNELAASSIAGINGDRVLTDNVELFDTLAWTNEGVFIIHLKHGFDVKMRDVRSQVINSATLIENDLRSDSPDRLKRHHARLVKRGRTQMPEKDFLDVFSKNRTYVLAYGTATKVTRDSVDDFQSVVARMETVSLSNQFRQIAASQRTQLRTMWVELAD